MMKLFVAAALIVSSAAHAQTNPRLLVWINGDKGYNGLQKVGDAFEKLSGVPVTKAPTFFAGHTIAWASGPKAA
jgi:maltose-binding protein MalE